MTLNDLTIIKLTTTDSLPWDLLLLADEEVQAIEKYIYSSDVFVAKETISNKTRGVMAMLRIDNRVFEIKALAVETSFQNQGIGKRLVEYAREIAIGNQAEELHVGTADCAHREIGFYETCGFKRFRVKRDFFVENYSKPLYENGIQLRDMVMLRMVFSN